MRHRRRNSFDLKIWLIATASVLAVVAAATGAVWSWIEGHESGLAAADIPEPQIDAGPLPALPDQPGTRCASIAVSAVRGHPSRDDGTIGDAVGAHLEGAAQKLGKTYRLIGWRGREDPADRDKCRVSLRYFLGEQRGAAVWLVTPDAPARDRLEPQDSISIDLTGRIPEPDPEDERALEQRCGEEAIRLVKTHFSFHDRYNLWACMRLVAARQAREQNKDITWRRFGGRAEANNRCLVFVGLTDDGVDQTEYWRVRFLPNDEHAVEPLTPRAIEVIYGPGVYSR